MNNLLGKNNANLKEIVDEFKDQYSGILVDEIKKVEALASYVSECFFCDNNKLSKDGDKSIKEICSAFSDSYQIPYHFIAFLIFHDKFETSLNNSEELDSNRDSAIQQFILKTKNTNEQIGLFKCFSKIKRHIYLAYYEKNYIEKHIKKLNERSINLDKKITETENKLSETEKGVGKVSQNLNNNTANYIAILGIFTAIIFSFLGGLNLFDKSAQYIDDKEKLSFYIVTGLTILFLVISFLLVGIDFIRQPNILNRIILVLMPIIFLLLFVFMK